MSFGLSYKHGGHSHKVTIKTYIRPSQSDGDGSIAARPGGNIRSHHVHVVEWHVLCDLTSANLSVLRPLVRLFRERRTGMITLDHWAQNTWKFKLTAARRSFRGYSPKTRGYFFDSLQLFHELSRLECQPKVGRRVLDAITVCRIGSERPYPYAEEDSFNFPCKRDFSRH